MKPGTKTLRLPTEVRQAQIVDIILKLADEHGMEGVTIGRIAAAAGVTERALYRHFSSRQEMLLAALDAMYDRIAEVFGSSDEPNVIDRLRGIGRYHSEIISSETATFIHPFYEFLAAPRELGLREPIGLRQETIMALVAAIVDEGKAQGSVRKDVDSEQVAWEVIAVHWAEAMAYLMGLMRFVTTGRSGLMLERLLEEISSRPAEQESSRGLAKDPASALSA